MKENHTRKDLDLEAKADEIRQLHEQCEDFTKRSEAAAKEAALNAWEAGERLQEVKDNLKHGQWLPWLKKTLPGISRATSYRYRKIAEFFETRAAVEKATEKHGCLKGLYREAGAIRSGGMVEEEDARMADQENGSGEADIGRLHRALDRLREVEETVLGFANSLPPKKWSANEKAQLLSTTKALLRFVMENGWWAEIGGGSDAVQGEEESDAT